MSERTPKWVADVLLEWAQEGRLRLHKDDFADYLSSVQKEWFLKRKLSSQKIILPEQYRGDRPILWRINWARVAELYSDYPVADYARDLIKQSENEIRREARDYLQKIAQAKPVEAEGSA